MALNTWKSFSQLEAKTKRILRELRHSEDEIAYILGHCDLSLHRLCEPYKTDVFGSISRVYNAVRADTLKALGHTEESADEQAVEITKGHHD